MTESPSDRPSSPPWVPHVAADEVLASPRLSARRRLTGSRSPSIIRRSDHIVHRRPRSHASASELPAAAADDGRERPLRHRLPGPRSGGGSRQLVLPAGRRLGLRGSDREDDERNRDVQARGRAYPGGLHGLRRGLARAAQAADRARRRRGRQPAQGLRPGDERPRAAAAASVGSTRSSSPACRPTSASRRTCASCWSRASRSRW